MTRCMTRKGSVSPKTLSSGDTTQIAAYCNVFHSPGTYSHDIVRDRKVAWPMKFGAPYWDLVVQPKKVTLRTEVCFLSGELNPGAADNYSCGG